MAKKKRGFIKYRSYLFVEKDPVIDAIRAGVSDAQMSYTEIEQASGVKASTVRNWLHGNVRRPQFATVAAVARSVGAKGIAFNSKGIPHLV